MNAVTEHERRVARVGYYLNEHGLLTSPNGEVIEYKDDPIAAAWDHYYTSFLREHDKPAKLYERIKLTEDIHYG